MKLQPSLVASLGAPSQVISLAGLAVAVVAGGELFGLLARGLGFGHGRGNLGFGGIGAGAFLDDLAFEAIDRLFSLSSWACIAASCSATPGCCAAAAWAGETHPATSATARAEDWKVRLT